VIEVDRPNRAERRRSGKSDTVDTVEAARTALGGRATGISKSKDGGVEAIRVLVVATRSARQARVKALTQPPGADRRHHRLPGRPDRRADLSGQVDRALELPHPDQGQPGYRGTRQAALPGVQPVPGR